MASINNTSSLGQFVQGLKDLSQGVKSNDAGDAANALSQILNGVLTAAQPLGDLTGITNLTAAAITATKIVRDYNDPDKKVDPLDFVAIGGNLTSCAIALGKNHPVLRGVNIILGVTQVALGSAFLGDAMGAISSTLGTTPDPLVKTIRYVDPLILDLDGDGLEITPLSRGVLFDANGDSIKTATAWAGADDGMLVWDRNGNGLIDSGRELFGDETILANGSKATNGKFNALDAQYASLRIWRDLNQDGISQAVELQTLQATGIQSINLASTASTTNYGDAILAQSGSYTRVDAAGATSTGQAGSFILAQNSFVRQFVPLTVSAEAQTLPNIAGSGWVRDLQEARKLNMPTCRRTSQYQVDSCSRSVLSSWRS
jgi:hypothetical protein